MILILPALGIFFAIGLIVFAFRRSGLHPGLGVFIAGLLLAFCLLSFELFLRVGYGYDLVRGPAPLPSFDGAPVTAALGVVVLLAAASCLIAFVVAIALLVRVWSKARPSRLLMSTTLVPPVLVLAFQYVDAGSDTAGKAAKVTHDDAQVGTLTVVKATPGEREGFFWARQNEVANKSACRNHSFEFITGCLRYVQQQANLSEATLAKAGARWAQRHDVESEEACESSSLADFNDRPAFIVGCKESIAGRNH